MADGSGKSELFLYWEQENFEPVLAREGDVGLIRSCVLAPRFCNSFRFPLFLLMKKHALLLHQAVYLWDRGGRIVSALAKSGDGSSKRYAPSTAERLHNSFHNLSQVLGSLRLACLAAAARFSLWPLIGSGAMGSRANFTIPLPSSSSLDLEGFAYCLLGDIALDLVQRAAAERSGTNKQSLSHAVAILGDRVHSGLVYGMLVTTCEGNYALLFLLLGCLEFVNCWLRIRRHWPHPKFIVAVATRAPGVLPIVALLSETFLVCAALSHPWLWPLVSSSPTPFLLWSPAIVTRILALACVFKHLVVLSQLVMSVQHLVAKVDEDVNNVQTSAAAASENRNEESFQGHKERNPELEELSDLVRRSYGSIDDFEKRHDPSRRARYIAKEADKIGEDDEIMDSNNSDEDDNDDHNQKGRQVRRSNRRGGGGKKSKKIASRTSTMSSVDDDDVSMDGRGAGGRDVSPVRPNLMSMRATRLTSLSGNP